ncbi:motility associated factor glycosyltransferase family protein [Campylobacter sp. TTU_617]|nr:6-hydroxymethylpterin diphosphokinase MptE-like protein [Campylobacter sp. TTU_617]MBK1971605.1 motility associated factor glycosyltransferase family protein [Campylobacter sp. TTU_617]
MLKNIHLKHIVVFEDDISLLYEIFHLIDFSEELKNNKLIVLRSDILTKDLENIFTTPPFFNFLRVYSLHLHSTYYESFQNDIIKLNQRISQIIKSTILYQGNDIEDTLQGFTQFIFNSPKMILNPSLSFLYEIRKEKSKTAIIVSTGPSLDKQLPLLKEYQNKATIFCADSAYSILAKYDIKPDYVLMSERTEKTAELFKNSYESIDKDIIFVLLALVHPKAIKYLESSKRNYILIPYPSLFTKQCMLEDFGNFPSGSTVALNALKLAYTLEHKNIIFIGQDLAYSQDGTSHSKDYMYGSNYESNIKQENTLAYGGKGEVKTHCMWNAFRLSIENFIHKNIKNCNFYNATEGGARIEGAIEKPFLECCVSLLNDDDKKFKQLKKLDIDKQNRLLLDIDKNIYKLYLDCDEFLKELDECLKNLEQDSKRILNKDFIDKMIIQEAIKKIDCFKLRIDDYTKSVLYEFIRPFLMQFEFNLARIYVLNPKNEQEWLDKNLTWIKDHIFLIQVLIANIKLVKKGIKENIAPLKQTLLLRNLKSLF